MTGKSEKTELAAHDPSWPAQAAAEGLRLHDALGSVLVTVHHIGSTSIPDIRAKPIIDLIPVVAALDPLDAARPAIEALGYEWLGPFGLPGRRYCRMRDPKTQRRLFHLHCYAVGSTEIDRHLAFCDLLRDRPDLARQYEAEKMRCLALNQNDWAGYGVCKNAWIDRIEAEALSVYSPAK